MSERVIPQDLWERIPEEDKVCINCVHLMVQDEGTNDMCYGMYPCCNYSAEWSENHFIPDDDYMKAKFGCAACKYSDRVEWCYDCKRWYVDQWEMRTK